MPAVSFQAISKTFATPKGPFQALNQVNLDIEEGEFFGLLGPNGAGKTTLISILAGLARSTSGRVLVQGSDVHGNYADARRKLGIVPQELVFDPFFNVREALRIQSGYFGVKNNDAWIDELLENLGLTDKANANMRQLSGGMKRRVLVAQALVHKPPIIVLDEPTAGVDVELRQTLWQFIARLNKEGHTVLLTTHYLEEAEALCGRIAMLKAGQVVALNRTSELLKAASGSVLQFKTDTALPPALAAVARVTGRIVQLPAHDAAEIENHLAALRVAEVEAQDMEIRRPDLEDVFLQVMSGTSVSNIRLEGVPAAAPGRPGQGAVPLGGSEDTAVPSVGAQQ
ncbi:ABC-2 type transport system ATP-binding protein [Acidovorax sp. 69]|uniref:ABC transporter ATP-binding protein n=1 Tax=Acidovorax sp. 69 TaxID=2035202 RepID=UPI000C23D531|nr:ABC transporter ATP-binding protein [Acidovorax sp. 69]PJI98957.1 ABC-2 type transport system ATP-binding protein [Acidovorax sp. 69]